MQIKMKVKCSVKQQEQETTYSAHDLDAGELVYCPLCRGALLVSPRRPNDTNRTKICFGHRLVDLDSPVT